MTLIGPRQISSRFSSAKKVANSFRLLVRTPDLFGAGEQLVKFGMVVDRFPHRIGIASANRAALANQGRFGESGQSGWRIRRFIPGSLCFSAFVPSQNAEQRKLAAIMFTDMVGYSALAQRDDRLALELLEEH